MNAHTDKNNEYYKMGYAAGKDGQALDFAFGSLPSPSGPAYQQGWTDGIRMRMNDYAIEKYSKKIG